MVDLRAYAVLLTSSLRDSQSRLSTRTVQKLDEDLKNQ